MRSAIKIAIRKLLRGEEIRTKLKEIKNEVEKEIVKIANDTIEKLNEMNPEIAQELKPKIPEPK